MLMLPFIVAQMLRSYPSIAGQNMIRMATVVWTGRNSTVFSGCHCLLDLRRGATHCSQCKDRINKPDASDVQKTVYVRILFDEAIGKPERSFCRHETRQNVVELLMTALTTHHPSLRRQEVVVAAETTQKLLHQPSPSLEVFHRRRR